jgi:hypothetical protein
MKYKQLRFYVSTLLLFPCLSISAQNIFRTTCQGNFSRLDSLLHWADVFVDPNEQYLIFCSTKAGGYGRGDLYVSFKKEDGTWSKSVNMGEEINTKHHELCPFVTMDEKYLFYTSDQDIYWVSTKIIDKIRERNQ